MTQKKRAISGSPRGKSGFIVGRARFAKISAVEGIVLTRQMAARAERFEELNIPDEERRRRIIQAHRKH